MKAEKLPSGSYRARVTVNGIRRAFTASTAKEAMRLANEWKYTQNPPAEDMTVAQAMERYIETESAILSPTTIDGYRKIMRNQFQSLMNIRLSRLSQADVTAAVNAEKIKGLSAKTISNAHGFLATVLRVYYPSLILNTRLPQKPAKQKQLPVTPQQIYQAVKGTDIELLVMLAMGLSLSMSEIRGLKKSDIVGGVLYVQRSKVYTSSGHIIKDEMKEENRARALVVPAYLRPLLSAVKTEYITEHNGQTIYRKFQAALKAADLPHITFHDLRHINASVMHLLGVPDKYAMERGGWKTDHTMKTVYQNTFSSERQKFDDIIDSFFENVVTNS